MDEFSFAPVFFHVESILNFVLGLQGHLLDLSLEFLQIFLGLLLTHFLWLHFEVVVLYLDVGAR